MPGTRATLGAVTGSRAEAIPGRAWYRQFWPWFLIGLPALSVAVSVATMVLAIGNADPLVEDDWYKRGLAINQDLDRDAAAARLGLAATLTVDAARGELVVRVDGGAAGEVLAVSLRHPTMAARDRAYAATRAGAGEYRAALTDVPAGRWYVAVEPPSGEWRLAAPMTLAPGVPARLDPAA